MIDLIKNFKSIRIINYILFLTLLYASVIFYTFDKIAKYDLIFFITNLVLLVMFFVINKGYEIEFSQKKKDIKKLLKAGLNGNDEDIKRILLKEHAYQENEETFKLFKNMYVRKNLAYKDYEDLKHMFYKFIPEDFIKEVGKMGTDRIPLGFGIKKNMHVMFLDMIGFTSITEDLEPDRVLSLLNIYYDGIVDLIRINGGFVDKFLGDGMIAIFSGEDSDGVLNTAIEIQSYVKKFQISEVGKNISVGIGINSGEVILGTIGSDKRMEITIIGDVVNTASRIEGLTRTFEQGTLISESCYKKVNHKDGFNISDLGEAELKGKRNKVKVYALKGKSVHI